MGGTVAVTLRKPDGTEYRMDRWTNSMPWGICNMRMLNSDEKHIESYLSHWLDMKDDYEKNKDTGNFEFDMTDCYFPSDGLAPCGYGLVVVDHVNKVILSMQGYTSFDHITASGISLEHNGMVMGTKPEDDDSNTTIFKEFWDAGRITKWMTKDSPAPSECESRDDAYIPVDKSFDEIMEILTDRRESFHIWDFKVDLGDWSYEEFDECDPDELMRMRERILELGFKISPAEETVWNNLIEEYKEEYGDE